MRMRRIASAAAAKKCARPANLGLSLVLDTMTLKRKRFCMTHVVSLRMPVKKVAALDRRAADSGLDRTRYLLRLVDQDLSQPAPKSRRRFASAHLLGKFRSQGSTNAAVRAALKGHGNRFRAE